MLEIGMHEHVSNQLKGLEIGSHKVMQAQNVVQIDSISSSYNASKETQDINDKQVLCNCR